MLERRVNNLCATAFCPTIPTACRATLRHEFSAPDSHARAKVLPSRKTNAPEQPHDPHHPGPHRPHPPLRLRNREGSREGRDKHGGRCAECVLSDGVVVVFERPPSNQRFSNLSIHLTEDGGRTSIKAHVSEVFLTIELGHIVITIGSLIVAPLILVYEERIGHPARRVHFISAPLMMALVLLFIRHDFLSGGMPYVLLENVGAPYQSWLNTRKPVVLFEF